MERYTRVWMTEQSVSYKSCPVGIEAAALLQDHVQAQKVAQVKFVNLAAKQIATLEVSIQPLDAAGNPLQDTVDFTYKNLTAKSGAFFGQAVPVVLPDANAASFAVTVKAVTYQNGATWHADASVPAIKEDGAQLAARRTKQVLCKAIVPIALIVIAIITDIMIAVVSPFVWGSEGLTGIGGRIPWYLLSLLTPAGMLFVCTKCRNQKMISIAQKVVLAILVLQIICAVSNFIRIYVDPIPHLFANGNNTLRGLFGLLAGVPNTSRWVLTTISGACFIAKNFFVWRILKQTDR